MIMHLSRFVIFGLSKVQFTTVTLRLSPLQKPKLSTEITLDLGITDLHSSHAHIFQSQ